MNAENRLGGALEEEKEGWWLLWDDRGDEKGSEEKRSEGEEGWDRGTIGVRD